MYPLSLSRGNSSLLQQAQWLFRGWNVELWTKHPLIDVNYVESVTRMEAVVEAMRHSVW